MREKRYKILLQCKILLNTGVLVLKKRINLDKVHVRVLPPKVIKLLAQFAYYLKKHNGVVIRLSSEDVLQDVHEACIGANFEVLDDIYEEIVDEISSYAPCKPHKKHKHAKALRVFGLS